MTERYFANLTEFALFMERAAAVELFADTAGRAQTAIRIVEHVKARIGNAQMLPPPLAAPTQLQRERLGFSADETLLRSGALRDSYRWAHESPRKTMAGSAEPKALWHELGVSDAGRDHTTVIPARFPLTRTVAEHEDELFALYVATFEKLFDPR